jgi:hypothetical protein
MRILPAFIPTAFLTTAFLAASPCMAQVVITNGADDSARHEDRAVQHEQAARDDQRNAHAAASVGDYHGAAAAQDDAQRHAAAAQHQEHRADDDRNSGVRVEIGH